MNLGSIANRRPPLEPVLPLINVVFLLLIFFMLAGQLAKKPSVEVATPVSAVANGKEQPDRLLLMLKADGQWFAGDGKQPLTDTELASLLAARAENRPAPAQQEPEPIRLLADAQVSMQQLRAHLQTLRALGVQQVRLVTREDANHE
ncbi:ferric siderophore transport system inner membrane protein E [Alcanivorax hongdengensis A-11-3]|uniref:Ferric siderophore transport system inner membrane protein E n=1 Tax=Alcanivorax hongdengensis A-11-3 TaxID=1177179 RepID=L0WGF2_9GAMM|nr:biopolymer transporter ExbD [Alcanivorax hongdengensis]EKF75804.1 ferric siderophore transport system inner membrane protein E [Alcanivorax hongdengensis A-11-3]